MTSAVLAAELGRHADGPERELSGAASLDAAAQADLSFVVAPKSFPDARRSEAGCLIAPHSYEPGAGQTVIRDADPRGLFARALALLFPPDPADPGVHPSAVIAESAVVSPSAEVGPFCSIGAGTIIGDHVRIAAGCRIGRDVRIGAGGLLHANVVVGDGTLIGERVVLQAGCVVGSDGFGFAPRNGRWIKFPQVGRVELGDDVEIGANSCVDRAALGWTRIGAGTKLDNMVHVGHNCTIGRHVVIAAQTGLSGGVTVGDGAVIGGQVGVGDKARIEPGVVLGSGSGVLTSKIVRAGQPLWGIPARPLPEYLEQLALVGRLPRWRDEMRALRARVEELERASGSRKAGPE